MSGGDRNFMNKYENGVIKYQIAFERYKNGIATEIINLLDHADIEISYFIKQTKGVYTKARYKEISRKLKEISSSLKEKISEGIDVEGVINYELKKEQKLFESIKPFFKKEDVNFIFPTVEQIRTSALFRPATDALTYESYLNGIEAGLFNIWDSAVRTGYLTGQTTQQIVRSVVGGISQTDKLKQAGTISSLRNSIYGNTRTLLQSFAEETREKVYKENEAYFGDNEYKYERLGVLDNRQCIPCGVIDGKLYKTIEEAQPVILHRNCRCMLIPYFKIEGDVRASKNGYVSTKITFDKWLDDQNEEIKKDVLGVARYKLYKEGVKLNQFVENGKLITLEELYESLDI